MLVTSTYRFPPEFKASIEIARGKRTATAFLIEAGKEKILREAEERVRELKTEQCFCKSYVDDDGQLKDCTCGKCS